jgi:hypothetical protein
MVTVSINGVNYSIPSSKTDTQWGDLLTRAVQAICAAVIFKNGGTQSLTADMNFGTAYGLLAKYFKSNSANIATSGIVRLANGEKVSWRNAANGANLELTVNGSDILQFNGATLMISGTATLDNLADVEIATPTTGQYLVYDGTKWANSTVTPGTPNNFFIATYETALDNATTMISFRLPFNCTLVSHRVMVDVAPDASATLDIHVAGSTILDGSKLVLTNTSWTTGTTVTTGPFATGALVELICDSKGVTVAGGPNLYFEMEIARV